MAVAKVILNGTTLIDVTQKTVTSGSMTSGTTALKNDGTDIVGSIATKSSADLDVSGATVTAPAGYYSSAASASVASGSATTPATTVTANPSISVSSSGLITATTSAAQSVTPTVSAGYVSSGTAGTITVSGSNTSQLTVYAGEHHSGTPSTISFTIDNLPYTANSGMTWTQWVASAYNTDGFIISGGYVKDSMGMMAVVDGSANYVQPSDTLIANERYPTAPA